MCRYIVFLLISGILWAQTDFDLEDLNQNSETYGDTIGPADYLGDICIVFLVMNHEGPVEAGSAS